MTAPSLHALLARWQTPRFAVIDGSQVTDIAALLRQADLSARALFLEQADPAIVAAGPFLAPVDGTRLDRLLQIPGIEAACVFWGGAVAEPVLFRHLRSLNLARIPAAEGAAPEMVLFRHYDPAVIAVILPVLRPAQRARMFGPMQSMALSTPDTGPLEASARADWPAAEPGWLTLDAAQMAAVTTAMRARSHRSIARYLRDTMPDRTAGFDDAALLRGIATADHEARGWGIVTEAGIGRFAWLMFATEGKFAEAQGARAYVTQGDAAPDRKLRRFMDAMAGHIAARAVS